jgi:hypothetical protein
MTSATTSPTDIAAFWRTSRRLYTIYSELNRSFEMGLPASKELESTDERSEPEVIARALEWMEQMDGRVQAWQLRQLLQSTNLQTEENLRALSVHYLEKKEKIDNDRDKIDFLLAQYFAHCAPVQAEQQLKLSEVGRVLEPVLGVVPEKFPDWVDSLDEKLGILNQCSSLEELQKSNALVDVREWKQSMGEGYLEVPALIAFTRFNFLARRAFFRAMHLDLHAIRTALNELESRGVTVIDCQRAGLGQQESLEHLRHTVHQWKTPFRAPYSGGNSFQPQVALRHILQEALEKPQNPAHPAVETVQKVVAEAAGPFPPTPTRTATKGVAGSAGPKPEPKSPAPPPAELKAVAVESSGESGGAQAQEDDFLDQCIADITRQIMSAPPKSGASVTAITLAGCKLLIATWEAEAFGMEESEYASVMQRAVAARTILHVGVERHKKHEPTDLPAALQIANVAAEQMRNQVARAKEANSIDDAVNLAATTKRLLGLIAEGEKLCK